MKEIVCIIDTETVNYSIISKSSFPFVYLEATDINKKKVLLLNQNSICDYIVNRIVNEAALGNKDNHIYIVVTNQFYKKSMHYSKKTIRFFINHQKKNNDVFYLLSNNPLTLLVGQFIGMIPKTIRRYGNGKQL